MHGSSKSVRKGIRTNISNDSGLRKVTYTQRDWDRTVGWGSVPEKYKLKKSEKIFIFLFGLGSLLMLTNVLHSFYLGSLLSRYTYQVSFIYYIFVAFIPIILFYKKRPLNA